MSKFLRRTAHVVSILALLVPIACAASAQLVKQQGADPKDAPAVTDQNSKRDVGAIADQLKAIREDATKRDSERRSEKQSYWYYWFWGDEAPVWSNWAVAVVAFFAGLVAYRAFNHEREAVRKTQRADITIEGINTAPAPAITAETTVVLDMRNWGKTRAKSVVFNGALGVPQAEKDFELTEDTSAVPFDIAANEGVPIRFRRTIGAFLPADVIADIAADKKQLRIQGKVTYKDTFGDPHWIEFEGVWNNDARVFEMTSYSANED